MRKRLYSLLNPEEKKLLKSYMSITELEKYIEAIKVEYEEELFPDLSL